MLPHDALGQGQLPSGFAPPPPPPPPPPPEKSSIHNTGLTLFNSGFETCFAPGARLLPACAGTQNISQITIVVGLKTLNCVVFEVVVYMPMPPMPIPPMPMPPMPPMPMPCAWGMPPAGIPDCCCMSASAAGSGRAWQRLHVVRRGQLTLEHAPHVLHGRCAARAP